jgi:hypothetical protein
MHGKKWRWPMYLRGHQPRPGASAAGRARVAKMMRERNPMKRPEVVARMKATTLERFPKGIEKSAIGLKNIATAARTRMSSPRNPMKNAETARKAHARCLHNSPRSKTENWFADLTIGMPIAFTGDGRCWIVRRNPDFVMIGQKAAIEVTQDEIFNSRRAVKRTIDGYGMQTIDHYARHGWRCLVIFMPSRRSRRDPIGLLAAVRSFLAGGESMVWRCGESFGPAPSTPRPSSTT